MVEVEVFKLSKNTTKLLPITVKSNIWPTKCYFQKILLQILQKCEKQRLMLDLGLVWKFK